MYSFCSTSYSPFEFAVKLSHNYAINFLNLNEQFYMSTEGHLGGYRAEFQFEKIIWIIFCYLLYRLYLPVKSSEKLEKHSICVIDTNVK